MGQIIPLETGIQYNKLQTSGQRSSAGLCWCIRWAMRHWAERLFQGRAQLIGRYLMATTPRLLRDVLWGMRAPWELRVRFWSSMMLLACVV